MGACGGVAGSRHAAAPLRERAARLALAPRSGFPLPRSGCLGAKRLPMARSASLGREAASRESRGDELFPLLSYARGGERVGRRTGSEVPPSRPRRPTQGACVPAPWMPQLLTRAAGAGQRASRATREERVRGARCRSPSASTPSRHHPSSRSRVCRQARMPARALEHPCWPENVPCGWPSPFAWAVRPAWGCLERTPPSSSDDVLERGAGPRRRRLSS